MELHRGVDLRAAPGTEVRAVIPLVVVKMGYDAQGGNFVTLASKCRDGTWPAPPNVLTSEGRAGHDDSGFRLTYCHLQQYAPGLGISSVLDRAGVLGLSGNSGLDANGQPLPPHLHLQVEWVEDGWTDTRIFLNPLIFLGRVLDNPNEYQAMTPGQFVAANQALILARGAPGAQASPGSVVVNVSGNGVSSINLGKGAALSGRLDPTIDVALPLSGIQR